jgi:hypothetical protein
LVDFGRVSWNQPRQSSLWGVGAPREVHAGLAVLHDQRMVQRSMFQVPFTRMSPMAFAVIALGSGSSAHATELVAANGITGAGTRSDGNGRAWAELGFSVSEEEAVTWTQLGLGLRLSPSLEVEAQLPVAYGIVERETSPDDGSGGGDDGFPAWLGNPYFGVNLLALHEPALRWRIGAGFTLPITGIDDSASDQELLPLWAAGSQDPHLWQPGGASLIGRGRVEIDAGEITLSLDLAAIVALRVLDFDGLRLERTTVLFLQPAFEVAGYVSPDTLVGARLPMVWGTLDEEFSLSVVPFLRQDLGDFFAEAQFTVNMIGPQGLVPPGDGPLWGMQLGIGARF